MVYPRTRACLNCGQTATYNRYTGTEIEYWCDHCETINIFDVNPEDQP